MERQNSSDTDTDLAGPHIDEDGRCSFFAGHARIWDGMAWFGFVPPDV